MHVSATGSFGDVIAAQGISGARGKSDREELVFQSRCIPSVDFILDHGPST